MDAAAGFDWGMGVGRSNFTRSKYNSKDLCITKMFQKIVSIFDKIESIFGKDRKSKKS